MKTLTLTQPWATLMAYEFKRIETRSWSTFYRGPVVIHAAKSFPDWAQQLCLTEPFRSVLKQIGWDVMNGFNDFPLGRGLGVAWLGAVKPVEEVKAYLSDNERAFGNYSPGRLAWCFDRMERWEQPIAARGKQGLWEWIA